jgi:uncharacterized membrane protein
MALLILGLVVFLGSHSVRMLAPDLRSGMEARLGEGAWKGLYSLVSLIGLVLLIWGYGQARPGAAILYVPPAWMPHLTALLMLFAFLSLSVSVLPAGRLKPALRHPMLVAVKIWAFAHLLANGDAASFVLFGAFLAWAVADRISVARRGRAGTLTIAKAGPVSNDIIAVAAGLVFYGLFVWKLHLWLIGVAPVG